MSELDDLDRRLIALLRTDARISTANLARRLDVPRTTVAARIARLERLGVIAGYGVRLGGEGRRALSAVVGITNKPKAGASVIKALARRPEIDMLMTVSGEYDLLAFLSVDNVGQLDHWLDAVGDIEGVERTTTSIVLATKIDRRGAD